MTRARLAIALGVVVVLGVLGVVIAASDDGGDGRVSIAQDPGGCRAPTGAPAPAGDPALANPADVAVSGARSVATGGLAPGAVVGTAEGPSWVGVRDARSATEPVGRIARVDPGAEALGQVVDVVVGCDLAGLAVAPDALWAGTCDAPADATSGAEVVELDPASGAIRRRIALPDSCVDRVAADATRVWVTTVPRFRTAARLLRVDVATGAVDEPVVVDTGETLLGAAATEDGVWTSRRGAAGGRLVRSDPATGAVLADVAAPPATLLGIVDGTLWTQPLDGSGLVARDATTGEVSATVPLADVVLAAAGPAGVYTEQASTASLTVTVSRADAAGAQSVTTYEGPGPDRTGLPLLGTLSVTPAGAWLAIQDRLFLLPA